MEYTRELLRDVAKMGAVEALSAIGLTTGEISQRQAYDTYGRKFIKDAVANGRLHPSSLGSGRTGTIRYAVADILAIRAEDRIQAATL